MRISGGYGDLKDKTFRIATMGEISLSDVDRLLEGMEKFISLGK
jgi:aspartate aminotransferase-like enzyme